MILHIILKNLNKFGGINFEKYKVIHSGKTENEFEYLPNPIQGYLEHKGMLYFKLLNKEDYNRLAYAFLEGANAFSASTKEEYLVVINQYYTNITSHSNFEDNHHAISEAIPKFKDDSRFDPKWKYDSNLQNDLQVILDLDKETQTKKSN